MADTPALIAISKALDNLEARARELSALPWEGYQDSDKDAIRRFLSFNPDILDDAPAEIEHYIITYARLLEYYPDLPHKWTAPCSSVDLRTKSAFEVRRILAQLSSWIDRQRINISLLKEQADRASDRQSFSLREKEIKLRADEVAEAKKQREARQSFNIYAQGGRSELSQSNPRIGGNFAGQLTGQMRDSTVTVTLPQAAQEVDLKELRSEIATLREKMRQEAQDPDHDIAVGEMGQAEKAAGEGNRESVVQHLSNAGLWALGIAEKIGVNIVTSILKETLKA